MKALRLVALVALLTAPAWPAIGAESRLFYTPAERARVTADRAAMLAREALAGAPPLTTIAPAAGDELPANSAVPEAARGVIAGPPRLDGISLTDDGRAYAWIGGRRYQDGDLFDGQRLRVMRIGIQLLGADGAGRLLRVGEAIRGAARQ